MATLSHKRKHENHAFAELANGSVNLKASVSERGTVISVEHEGTIRELVENIAEGIEHSFAIASGPPRPFSLRLGVETDGISKIAEHNSNLCFWGKDGPVFVYQNLIVRDANGNQVQSTMNWETEGPHIVLNVLEAPVFPILIDPLATIPGKNLQAFKLPENLLSFLGPGAKVVDVSCSSSIANISDGSDSDTEPAKKKKPSQQVPKSKASLKISLPSFSKNFPSFTLPTQWLRSLYGSKPQTATSVAKGKSSSLSFSSLPDLDIGLDWQGVVRYGSKSGWDASVVPPELDLGSTQLLQGPDLLALRGDNGEVGLSFYKQSSRHFFFLSKPLKGKFSLHFKLNGGAKLEYDNSNHYLSITEGGRARIIYSSPILRLPSSSVLNAEWDVKTASFSVSLPSTAESYPLILAFSVSGKKPEGPTSLTTLFPSLKFKLGSKGELVEGSSPSASSSSGDDEVPGKKKQISTKSGSQVVPARKKRSEKSGDKSSSEDELEVQRAKVSRRVTGQDEGSSESSSESDSGDESVKRRKFGLPSLSLKFPSFKFGRSWTAALYGPNADDELPNAIAPGQLAIKKHPSLNGLETGLSWDGSVEYGNEAVGWKVKLTPVGFNLSNSRLLSREGLQVLRGDDGETGLSFDKNSSRHFFVFGKSAHSTKFQLQFEQLVGSTSLQVNPEEGYAVVGNADGSFQVVYSSPLVRLAKSKRTSSLPLEWDADSSSITVQLPATDAPIILAFGLTFQIPEKPHSAFPSFKAGFVKPIKRLFGGVLAAPVGVESYEPEKPSTSFKLSKSWNSVLYGKDFHSLKPVASPATHKLQGLNKLEASLFSDGDVEYSTAGWKVRLSPNSRLNARRLLQAGSLQLVRGDDGETGLSSDSKSSRHFFLFDKAQTNSTLLLRLEQIDGSTALEYNPDVGYVAFKDSNDKILLVYSTPVLLLPTGEVITAPITWDGENSGISIQLPPATHPLLVVFGVGANAPENVFSLFPGLRIKQQKGITGEDSSDESGSSSSEGEGKEPRQKRRGPKVLEGVEQAMKFVTGKPTHKKPTEPKAPKAEKPDKEKIGFSVKFPSFSLGKTLHSLLYPAHDTSLTAVTKGNATLSHPSLGLEVGLTPAGEVEFGTKGWQVALTPNLHLTSPSLLRGSSTQVLRADDGEIGLSFDKDSTRHFFLFAKAPTSPFLLTLGQIDGSTSLEFNEQEGYAAFSDQDKLLLVYTTPILRQANNKTVALSLAWDGETSSISVAFPSDVSFPAVLAFGVSNKLPTGKGANFHFPSLRVKRVTSGQDGSSSSEDSSSEEGKPRKQRRETSKEVSAQPDFALKFPSFKINKSWFATLYGDIFGTLTALSRGKPASFPHPSLNNLDVSLLANGAVEFGNKSWQVKLTPQDFQLTSPKLFKREGLQLLRGDDGETGLSFDKNSSRHFFFFGKAPTSPKLALQLEQLAGSAKLELNPDLGYVAFSDNNDKLLLVYSAPVALLPNNKSVPCGLEWDGSTSSIVVQLPSTTDFPLVLAFGVGAKLPKSKSEVHFAFPSIKFRPTRKATDESSSSDEEKGKTSKKISFGLPSFLKNPQFSLGKTWTTSLYGESDSELSQISRGRAALSKHDNLNNLDLGLKEDGKVEFATDGWKVSLSPSGFPLSASKLYQRDGLQLVRGDDGETGISFNKKEGTRHFFFFGKAPTSPKLLLKLEPEEGSIGLEFSPEDGYIAFSQGEGEAPLLVYNSPTLLLAGNKTSRIPLEWDGEASAIAVTLPPSPTIPFVLSFEVTGKIPEAKPKTKFSVDKSSGKTKVDAALGAVQSAFNDQEDYSDEDELSAKPKSKGSLRVSKKISFPSIDFSAKFPTFKLNKSWLTTLYGPDSSNLTPVTQGSVHLDNPSLNNLKVGLLQSGEVEYGYSDWKVRFLPNFTISNPKLLSRPGLQVLRGDDGETGVSFDKSASRHFFIFLKAPTSNKLTLALKQVDGSTKTEFNKEGGYVAFSNAANKLLLVYSHPIARLSSNKTVDLPIEWDADTSSVFLTLPELTYPLVVTIGVSNQIPKSKADSLRFLFSAFRKTPGTGEDTSSSSSSDEDEKESRRKKRAPGRLNIALPSALNNPTFKLGRSWGPLIYGTSDSPLVQLPAGQSSSYNHPSLQDLNVVLLENGDVEYGSGKWKIKLSPLPGLGLTAAAIHKRDGLYLLRGDEGETGISYDKNSSRHFFVFSRAPANNKLVLKLEQLNGATKLEYNPESGYLAFADQDGKTILVYSSPIARLPSNKTIQLPIEWDGASSAISIKLPEDSYPLVLVFGLSSKTPKSKKDFLSFLFPWLKFKRTSDDFESSSSSDSEGEGKKKAKNVGKLPNRPLYYNKPASSSPVPGDDKKRKSADVASLKVGVPQFAAKSTTFDLGRTWISNLYGTADAPFVPVTGDHVRHSHPSLNLAVDLSPSGEADFSAPDWKVKLAPVNFTLTSPKLLTANGVQLVRGDDGEVGLSFDKHSSRHFFFFGKNPADKFTLTFSQSEGTSRVEFNKEKGSIAFLDGNGKVRLVYSAPTVKLSNNQTATTQLEWDPATSSIVVSLPEPRAAPMVLALAIGLKYVELKGDGKGQGKFGAFGRSTPEPKESKEAEGSSKLSSSSGQRSFTGKTHNFKLDRTWLINLYGGTDVQLTYVPSGKAPKLTHAALNNLDATLLIDGSAEFGSGEWKVRMIPVGFVLTTPSMHRGDGVQVLKSEDGEIGLFADKVTSRHFFVIAKPLVSPKFSIKMTQALGSSKIEFSKDKGFVAFTDPSGKYRMVYSAPAVQSGTGKITSPPVDWDTASSTMSIMLPDLVLPVCVALQLGTKVQMGPRFRTGRASGSFEPIDFEGEPQTRERSDSTGPIRSGIPSFLFKFPGFKLPKIWKSSLYGPQEVTLSPSSVSRTPIPALNGLECGVALGGDIDFGAPDWKVKLAPVNFPLTSPKLYKADSLQLVRAEEGETGISFDKHSLRHFFFFGKAPISQKFCLKLTSLNGSCKAEVDKENGLVYFVDQGGRKRVVYTAPIALLGNNKTVPLNIDWDGPLSAIAVHLPDLTYPLVVAFGVSGKVPESRAQARSISFPSFKFTTSGDIEMPEEEEDKPRSPGPSKKKGFSIKTPKVNLPSISLKFPNFKLGKTWCSSLYGKSQLNPVPEGQLSKLNHPALPQFEVNFSHLGDVQYVAPDLKVSVSPVAFTLTAPKLLKSDTVQVLRADDGEIGLVADDFTKHFFLFGKAPTSTKFALKFNLSGAQVDFNKEKGYLSLSAPKGAIRLVYFAPVALLSNSKSSQLPVDWDASSSTLTAQLADLSFPTIIAFGVGTKIPDAKEKPGFSFIRRIGASRDEDDSDSSEDDQPPRRTTKPASPFSFRPTFPAPHMGFALYGKSKTALTEVPVGQVSKSFNAHLGLDLELNPQGELDFATPSFKVKFSPNVTLDSPKLLKRDGLQLLRANDGEIGVSFAAESPAKHFFILDKAPSQNRLVLKLALLNGGLKLESGDGYIAFKDNADKIYFVYHSPVAQFGTKTSTLPLEWDGSNNAIVANIPESATYPVLIAFGVSPKILHGREKWGVVFPSLRRKVSVSGDIQEGSSSSESSSSESDEEEGKPKKVRTKKFTLPSFFGKFSASKLAKWIESLYGKGAQEGSLEEGPIGKPLIRQYPSIGLSVSLDEDGVVEFSNPSWKGKFSAGLKTRSPKLFGREGLQLLRHREGEVGLSFDKDSIRHFFVINSPVQKFLLNFEQIEGNTKLELHIEKGVVSFADESGKIILVYASPVLLSGGKTTPLPLSWDEATGSISISFATTTKFPAVLAFGISKVVPQIHERYSLFPVKVGQSGNVEESDEESESDEEAAEPAEERRSKKIGLPSIISPIISLGKSWTTAIYGSSEAQVHSVPGGSPATLSHPSLSNIRASLLKDGSVDFALPQGGWTLRLSPSVSFIRSPELYLGEKLQVLRGDGGEIGLSYDGSTSKHFFVLHSAPSSYKFSLVLSQLDGSSKFSFNKEKGFLSISDASGKLLFVYHAPVARPSSGKSITLPLDWDTATSSLSVTIPLLEYPAILVYGLSTSLPDLKASGGIGIGIGKPSWLKIPRIRREDGGSSSSSDEDEKVKGEKAKKPEKTPEKATEKTQEKAPEKAPEKTPQKYSEKDPEKAQKAPEKTPEKAAGKAPEKTPAKTPEKTLETKEKDTKTSAKGKEAETKTPAHTFDLGKFGFSAKFPSFKLDTHWLKALYGDKPSTSFNVVPAGQSSSVFHPSLNNLKVALSPNGEIVFHETDWRLIAATSLPVPSDAKLVERDGLQLLRSEDGEIGLSCDKKSTRLFVLLGKSPAPTKLSLKFKMDNGCKAQYIKEKGLVVFLDSKGKPRLVFSSPVGRISNDLNFTFPIEWDGSTCSISVSLPLPDPAPIALAFALYSKPPEEKKSSGKWGIGSALSAVTSTITSSLLSIQQEGFEPAVAGIDAPIFDASLSATIPKPAVSASVSLPSFSIGADIGLEGVKLSAKEALVNQEIQEPAVTAAFQAPISIDVGSESDEEVKGKKAKPKKDGDSSDSSSSSSSSEDEGGRKKPKDKSKSAAAAKVKPDDKKQSQKGVKGLQGEKEPSKDKDAKEKATKEKEAKEKDAKAAKDAKDKADKEAKDKAEKDAKAAKDVKDKSDKEAKEAKEREAAKDKAEKDAKEKAAKDKEAADRAAKEAKDKAEKELKDAQEKADKASKDIAEKEAKQAKEAKEKADKEAKEKADKDTKAAKDAKDNADKEAKEVKEKADKDARAAKEAKDKADKEAKDKAEKDAKEAKEKDAKAAKEVQQAKEKADKEAKDKADKDAKEAKEKVEKEAKAAKDAKDKADKEAKEKAEKDAKEAKDKADKDAKAAKDAKDKADKEAREKAEKDAKEAKDKADRDAKEAKDKADKEAKEAKEKSDKDAKAAKEAKDKADKDAKEAKDKADKEAKEKAEKDAKAAKDAKDKAEKDSKDAKDKADKDAKAAKDAKDKADKDAKEKAEKDIKDAKDKAEKEVKEKAAKAKADKDKEDKDKAKTVRKGAKPEREGKEKKSTDSSSSSSSSSSESDGEGGRRRKGEKHSKIRAQLEEEKRKKREHEETEKARRKLALAPLGALPSASFGTGFRTSLYGKVDLDNFLHEAPKTTLYSATTNLTFSISATDGVLSVGPAHSGPNAWSVRVIPVSITWNAEKGKLFKGSSFVSVRNEGLEIGAMVREDMSSQFFVLSKGNSLVLRFETSGIGAIKYDEKDGETLFSDIKGNPLFIYSTPSLHSRTKAKVNSSTSYDSSKKELRIDVQGYVDSLAIVCAICTKCITLPPDDVLYSMPDGSFIVVHPRVNFIGIASSAGVTYKSLTPETNPWSITFSLQGAKKVYAQSKCTVVILRDGGIREYLAYVDRGEYVGLHQSFHLHNPPTSYPIRIPLALSLTNITEVAETSDTTLTFHTQNGPVFAYGNVVVLDARGSKVESRIRLENADSEHPSIVLEILEEGEFPLVIS